MREMTACFTGHRFVPLIQRAGIRKKLEKTVRELIAQGYRYFGAGGALGFDTMAADAVLRLRREFPDIKLILVLPCKTQADCWSARDREIYEKQKAAADKVVYVAEQYYNGCMLVRNRRLVDNSSVCVAYQTHASGGTAYTVQYAKQSGVPVISIN